MSYINDKINSIYKINSTRSFSLYTNYDIDSYTLNIIIVIIISLFIFYLYVRLFVSIDMKNWEIMKCNPKYLFISGYLKQEPGLTANETNMNNFIECTQKTTKGINENLLKDTLGVNIKKSYDNAMNSLDSKQTDINKYKDDFKEIVDISGVSFLNDTPENKKIEQTYGYLKTSGIYVDYYNRIVEYVTEYINNYLSYLIVLYANKYKDEIDKGVSGSDTNKEKYLKSLVTLRNIQKDYMNGNNI